MQEKNNIWKYLQQELKSEENEQLRSWMNLSEENKGEFEDIQEIWEESNHLDNIELEDIDKAWAEIDDQIIVKSPIRLFEPKWIAIAASFLLVTSFTLWFFILKPGPLYDTFRTGDEKAEIQLVDGSKVKLEENSSLKYYTRIDKDLSSRTVYIDGMATFEVAKDSLLPFIVEVDKTGVKALGTIFKVEETDSSNISVENIEGLIKFYELENEDEGIVLKKGEKFKYNGSSFVNLAPPKKIKPKGKIYTLEQVIDLLFQKYDGKFNTGPYGNFDLGARIRIDMNQSLKNILYQLSIKTNVEYSKTCPDCYELRGLNLPK